MTTDSQLALMVEPERERAVRNNKSQDMTEENHSFKSKINESCGQKKGIDLGSAEAVASEGDEQWMQRFKSLVLQDQDLHLSILRYEVSSHTSHETHHDRVRHQACAFRCVQKTGRGQSLKSGQARKVIASISR